MKYLIAIVSITLISSCATLEKTVTLGAGVGLVTGTTIGMTVPYHRNGTVLSATLGGLIGAGLGWIVDESVRKKKKIKKTENNSLIKKQKTEMKSTKTIPYLAHPEVEKICVGDKIQGNQYIEGHCIYHIKKPSLWSQP